MCVVLGGSVLKPRSEGMEALQLQTSSACCHRNAQLSCTGRKFPLCRKGTGTVMPDRARFHLSLARSWWLPEVLNFQQSTPELLVASAVYL